MDILENTKCYKNTEVAAKKPRRTKGLLTGQGGGLPCRGRQFTVNLPLLSVPVGGRLSFFSGLLEVHNKGPVCLAQGVKQHIGSTKEVNRKFEHKKWEKIGKT